MLISRYYKNRTRRLAGGGLLAGIGDALYGALPPVQVPYIAVKRATPFDAGSVSAKLQQESLEAGTQLSKNARDEFTKSLEKADYLAHDKGLLTMQLTGLDSELQAKLRADPLYLANPVNRQQVASAYDQIINSRNTQLFADRKKQVDDFYKLHKDNNSLDQLYINPETSDTEEDERGRPLTNRDVYNESINGNSPRFARLFNLSDNDPIGTFQPNTRIGTLNDTNQSVDELTALIQSSSADDNIDKVLPNIETIDAYNAFLRVTSINQQTLTNQNRIDAAVIAVAQNWQTALDDKAVNGIMQRGYQLFAGMTYEGEGIPPTADGQKPQLTNAQALAYAKQTGNQTLYEELQSKRQSFTQTFGAKHVENRIRMREQVQVKSSRDVRYTGLDTAAKSRGKSGSSDELLDRPFFIPSEQNDVVFGDTSFFSSAPGELSVAQIGASSVRPDDTKTVERKSVSGDVYVFSNKEFGKNAAFDGRSEKLNTTLENVQHVDNGVYAVTTGVVERYDKSTGKWVEVPGETNRVILKGGNRGNFKIDENATYQTWEKPDVLTSPERAAEETRDRTGEMYYLTEDGRERIYFKPKAMEKWVDAANERVILIPESLQSSLRKYGEDITFYSRPKTYLTADGFSREGDRLVATLQDLQQTGQVYPEMLTDMQRLATAGEDLSDETNRQIINDALNKLQKALIKRQLQNTVPRGTEKYNSTRSDAQP